jgi:hypothetical protein
MLNRGIAAPKPKGGVCLGYVVRHFPDREGKLPAWHAAAVTRNALNDNIIRERAFFEPCRT